MTTASSRSMLVPSVLVRIYVHDAGPAGAYGVDVAKPVHRRPDELEQQLSELHELGVGGRFWSILPAPDAPPPPAVFTMERMRRGGRRRSLMPPRSTRRHHRVVVGRIRRHAGGVGRPDRVSALVLSNTGARSVPFALRRRNRLLARLIQAQVIPGGPSRLIVPD